MSATGAIVPIQFRICDANGVSVGPPRLATVAAPIDKSNKNAVATGSCEPLLGLLPTCLPVLNPAQDRFEWQSSTQMWQFRQDTRGLTPGFHKFWVQLNDGTHIEYVFNVQAKA